MGRLQGDLPTRTYRFALSIMSLVKEVPNEPHAWNITRQLIRCGTSIGANTQEADGALTDREFIHMCNIARKEAMETHYWLRLAQDAGLLTGQDPQSITREAEELVKILSTIVRKSREHLDS